MKLGKGVGWDTVQLARGGRIEDHVCGGIMTRQTGW